MGITLGSRATKVQGMRNHALQGPRHHRQRTDRTGGLNYRTYQHQTWHRTHLPAEPTRCTRTQSHTDASPCFCLTTATPPAAASSSRGRFGRDGDGVDADAVAAAASTRTGAAAAAAASTAAVAAAGLGASDAGSLALLLKSWVMPRPHARLNITCCSTRRSAAHTRTCICSKPR
jgi:hypothetical protein